MTEAKPTSNLPASQSKVEMEIVVRDKDGNVKYAGPLVMNVVGEEPIKE